MDYSFYLFSQLFDLYHNTDMPYDIKYTEVLNMYKDYLLSDYNSPNYGEYECMCKYLSENIPMGG